MTERDRVASVLNSTEISQELSKEDIYKFADALIAAGIGDVAAHKAEAEYWEKICKFESVEYHTTIKNAAEHARHLMQERDEYKHRAGVAEVFLALIDYQFKKMKHRAEERKQK